MFLEDTSFYEDSRLWRRKFFEMLKRMTPQYWRNYEFDLNAHVDKTYVLHLPHRTDKIKELVKNLKKVKTKGSDLSESVTWWEGSFGKTEWDLNIHNPNYSFWYCWSMDPDPKLYLNLGRIPRKKELESINVECSLAESNIALGHVSILQDIVDNNIDRAFILEDDVQFTIGFSYLMDRMFKQLPEDWDMFYVSYHPCMWGFKSEPYSEDIVKIKSGVWWLSGVFVSQRAAKKLLSNLPVIGPIDVWINYHMSDLNVYGAMYNCIGQNGEAGSDNTHSYKMKLENIAKDI